MTAGLSLPAGVNVTLLAAAHQFAPAVLITLPGMQTDLTLLLRSGTVSAVLTHEKGVSWPDAAGVALINAAMQAGGFALLAFARKRDAEACAQRLQRAVAP